MTKETIHSAHDVGAYAARENRLATIRVANSLKLVVLDPALMRLRPDWKNSFIELYRTVIAPAAYANY